jgi:hypothetical protein
MPPLPSAEEARRTVRTFVASFAQMKVSEVALTMVLRNPPLRLDDNALIFLATSLRGYVQSFTPNATIKAASGRRNSCSAVPRSRRNRTISRPTGQMARGPRDLHPQSVRWHEGRAESGLPVLRA